MMKMVVEYNIFSILFIFNLFFTHPVHSFHSTCSSLLHYTMKSHNIISSLPTTYQWTVREEMRDKTIHFEVYPSFYPHWMITHLFSPTQTLKPVAKVGVRMYSSTSSQAMDHVIASLPHTHTQQQQQQQLPDTPERSTCAAVQPTASIPTNGHPYRPPQGKWSIGLFVYMWVSPTYRGQGLGEVLLERGKAYCREKGDSHMLLVHDDQGSGRLVQYYEQQGFLSIETILDKGMICKL